MKKIVKIGLILSLLTLVFMLGASVSFTFEYYQLFSFMEIAAGISMLAIIGLVILQLSEKDKRKREPKESLIIKYLEEEKRKARIIGIPVEIYYSSIFLQVLGVLGIITGCFVTTLPLTYGYVHGVSPRFIEAFRAFESVWIPRGMITIFLGALEILSASWLKKLKKKGGILGVSCMISDSAIGRISGYLFYGRLLWFPSIFEILSIIAIVVIFLRWKKLS